MYIILLNILQEILSTFKTLNIVRGKVFLATICKVLTLMVSTLATAIVLGNTIDIALLTNVGYIALGTIIGSMTASVMDRKNRKPQVFKYTIKFCNKEAKESAITELVAKDIDHIAIGTKTLIAYGNNKNESRVIKKLKNAIQMECLSIRNYNLE